ncbi:MAG: hypothetical protein ACI8RD_002777 [Bacillariaceae sp.]|jgi:hypothetical protein
MHTVRNTNVVRQYRTTVANLREKHNNPRGFANLQTTSALT